MDFKTPAERLGLDEDEYIELIELFLETGGNDLKGLEAALANNDQQSMVERAHSLKGASGNLGLTDIYEKAKDVENRSRENDIDGIDDTIEEIKNLIKKIVTALES